MGHTVNYAQHMQPQHTGARRDAYSHVLSIEIILSFYSIYYEDTLILFGVIK
jgi:hypothetical protein